VHFQGDAVIFHDDFEEADAVRKISGSARRNEGNAASGKWRLSLTAPGDSLQYQLPDLLASGWFEARFWDSGAAVAPFCCEFDFESKAGTRTVQVILSCDADSYALATPQGPSLPVQRIARRPGWNRLAMRFSPDRITLLINDAVLTHRGSGVGSLQSVRFVVHPGDDEPGRAKGSQPIGSIDDVQLAAGLGAAADRQPAHDQDDLLLTNGDQLFGQIKGASNRGVTIESEFGSQQVPWPELQEVHFTPRLASPKQVEGTRVRIEFATTATPLTAAADNDLLEGVLRDISDDAIRLRHPYLGDVSIPRSQMRSIELLETGRWLAIDPGFYHFGEQVNVRLQVPHPGGTDRSWLFELEDIPQEASLVLHVAGMQAAPAGDDPNKRAADQWRTYATINDTTIDPMGLNHLLVLNYRSPARLKVPIANGILRNGKNVLRIHQTPLKDDPRSFDDCGIFGIGLQWSHTNPKR
jgi:hypothetical protein